MSITNADHLCINCMREKADDGVCPFCGFDESKYEPSPHHLPPRSILGGKCLIGRVLGEGGFGITYMGWDLNLDLKLAIKEYYPTGFVTRTNTTTNTVTPYRGEKAEFFTTGRSRFINEAKTLAKYYTLPGIVSVRDFFLENGTAYIVMEFVEGETLKQRLARVGGKMDTAEVFDLVRPLLRSLAEMHASGLIHRDISPDNIMITPEGNVKLIDFGAARDYLDSGNRSLSVMLKPGYAPEEQYFARGQQGPWTDIYALCATIYRAITGQTPPESVERLRRDELKAPSTLGVHITPAQEAALLKGLAVAQEDRWQSIPELNQALYQSEISLSHEYPKITEVKTESSQPVPPETKPSPELVNIKSKAIWLWTNKKKHVLISAGVLVLALIAILSIPVFRANATYQKVEDYFAEDSSRDAVAGIIELQQSSPDKASELIDDYEEEIYEYGVNQYQADDIDHAKEAFDLLSVDYERTSDYLVLIQVSNAIKAGTFTWDWSDENDPDRECARKLIEIADFENAGALLTEKTKIAILFLLGYWSSGSEHFDLKYGEEEPFSFTINQSVPGLRTHYWSITCGELYFRNENDDKVKSADITIIDKNTISITVTSSNVTYTLHRKE